MAGALATYSLQRSAPFVTRLIVLAFASVILLTAALPVSAAEVTPEQGVAQLEMARTKLENAIKQYAAGDPVLALTSARSAYLDHFEVVEFPLRVRDEVLTLELEEEFALLRSRIQAGAPAGDVRAVGQALLIRLDDAERELSSPGVAAPAIAFGYAFTILFREGLEAMLVIALLMGALAAARATRYRRAMLSGVATAGLATVATWAVITLVLNLAPAQRELLEALMTLAAVVMLFYVSFWLIARMDQRRWMEFMRARVSVAAGAGSAMAMFGIGFTAVYREGIETVLFYQALLSFARGLDLFVFAGVVAALCVLVVVGWAIFRAGRRIPLKMVLGTAVVMIMVISVAFVGNAARALQQVGLFPITVADGVPSLPFFLAELSGWHPTVETIAAQVSLGSIYVVGAIWTFWVLPRRVRRFAAGRRVEGVAEG